MINFLAFIGWSPKDEKEILTPQEFINLFEISQIHISGGKFNEEKLDWMNKEHLKLLSKDEQNKYIEKFIPENLKKLESFNIDILNKITPIIIERISKGSEIIDMANNGELSYFFEKPSYNKESLIFKSTKITDSDKYKVISSYLSKVIFILENIPSNSFTKEIVKEKLWDYATEVGRGDILWPMRYAFSGLDKSPDPFLLAEILGKEESIERLNFAIQLLQKV